MERSINGCEMASITEKIMNELNSIQAKVGAYILGVTRTCSHAAIRKELGWESMRSKIYKRKLLYWKRVAGLDSENWANRAFEECKGASSKAKGAAWNSLWYTEIFSIFVKCRITDIFSKHPKMNQSIRKWVDSWEERQTNESLKGSSLKYLPEYKTKRVPQYYINHSVGSKMLAKFRLGDTRVVEHGMGKYKTCPVCSQKGIQFIEAHMTFESPSR